MQINVVDDDILTPTYTCGKRGETIDVQEHGVNYSVWKLLDNLEKHVGPRSKVSCKICDGETAAFERLISTMMDLGESAKGAATKMNKLGKSINPKRAKGNK